LEPLAKRWASFGWHVFEVDGHSIKQLVTALDEFENIRSKPTVIIAHTVKGKGVSFMENKAAWHGKAPNQEQLQDALKELK
jgi:transketolase